MPSTNFRVGDRVRGADWFESIAGELGTVVEVVEGSWMVGQDLVVQFDRTVRILNRPRTRFQHSAHNFAYAEETPPTDDDSRDSDSNNQFEDHMVMLEEFRDTGAHYSEALRRHFPLFRGTPPPNHPYPEAWRAALERVEPFSGTSHRLFEAFSGTSYRLQ